MARIKINGKEIHYKPYINSMYIEKLQLRLVNDKSFIRVFKNNITDQFIDELKDIVNPNTLFTQNSILSVHGLTGTGKSTFSISLVKSLVPDRFSVDNICFFDSEILELAQKLPRDSFIIRDEGVDKAIFGVGSRRTEGQLNVLVETCRKAGLSVIFIEPRFKDNEMVKYYLETIDIDIENRLTRVGVIDVHSKKFIGAIYIKILDDDDPLMISYEKKKDDFIEKMKKGDLNKAKQDFKKISKKIYQEIDIEVFKTKKQRFTYILSKYGNYTKAEVEIIATFLEILISNGEYSLDDEDDEM